MSKRINDIAIQVLADIWAAIDFDKFDVNRAYGIWDEFASKVKSAASTTNSFEGFIEKICKKLGIRSLVYKDILSISKADEETKAEVLKELREKTILCVLAIRCNNDLRKKLNEKLKEEGKEDRYKANQILKEENIENEL